MTVPAVMISPAFIDKYGLRKSLTFAMTLIFLGCVSRCITTKHPYALILAHIAQILNSLSGPILLTVPPLVSAQWFPPQSRATATSLGFMANYFGTAISYTIALIVNKTEQILPLLRLCVN